MHFTCLKYEWDNTYWVVHAFITHNVASCLCACHTLSACFFFRPHLLHFHYMPTGSSNLMKPTLMYHSIGFDTQNGVHTPISLVGLTLKIRLRNKNWSKRINSNWIPFRLLESFTELNSINHIFLWWMNVNDLLIGKMIHLKNETKIIVTFRTFSLHVIHDSS